jgi:HORMA domain-containing protein
MSMSYTTNDTFSIIHARRIASRVATDLLRFQSFYGLPSDKSIDDYEEELAVLLNHDVLAWVEYGFQRNGKWTEAAVRYTALPGGTLVASDDPGKIRPNLDVAGAQFTSFLDYNSNWCKKSEAERAAIAAQRPFTRGTGSEPPLESGYWASDLNYTAGGRGLGRATARR